MTSERGLWVTARRELSPYGTFKRIENRVDTGMPDVLYCISGCTGLLELKEEEKWPTRAGSPVTIESLTREQVIWHQRWAKAGGAVHMLVQIERDYLLLNPETTAAIFAREVVARELKHIACVCGHQRFPTRALLRYLLTHPSRNQKPLPSYTADRASVERPSYSEPILQVSS